MGKTSLDPPGLGDGPRRMLRCPALSLKIHLQVSSVRSVETVSIEWQPSMTLSTVSMRNYEVPG